MKNRTGLALAVAGGYVLGRTKKGRLALGIGGMVLGKRLDLSPQKLAGMVGDQLRNNPQLAELGGQLREDFSGVGKAATGALVNRQLESLADSLHGRTQGIREQLAPAALLDETEEEEEEGTEGDEAPAGTRGDEDDGEPDEDEAVAGTSGHTPRKPAKTANTRRTTGVPKAARKIPEQAAGKSGTAGNDTVGTSGNGARSAGKSVGSGAKSAVGKGAKSGTAGGSTARSGAKRATAGASAARKTAASAGKPAAKQAGKQAGAGSGGGRRG